MTDAAIDLLTVYSIIRVIPTDEEVRASAAQLNLSEAEYR